MKLDVKYLFTNGARDENVFINIEDFIFVNELGLKVKMVSRGVTMIKKRIDS